MNNTAMDLAEAYEIWKKHKNFKNLKTLYQKSFTGGNPVWKLYRFITGMLTGRYERFYQYWSK